MLALAFTFAKRAQSKEPLLLSGHLIEELHFTIIRLGDLEPS